MGGFGLEVNVSVILQGTSLQRWGVVPASASGIYSGGEGYGWVGEWWWEVKVRMIVQGTSLQRWMMVPTSASGIYFGGEGCGWVVERWWVVEVGMIVVHVQPCHHHIVLHHQLDCPVLV